jgi:hypothetical protein
VKPGEEAAFVQEWTEFAPWEGFDVQQAWKDLPEFRERIMRARS